MKEMRSDPENLREGPVWLFTGEQVKKGNRGGPVFGDVLTEAPPRLDVRKDSPQARNRPALTHLHRRGA